MTEKAGIVNRGIAVVIDSILGGILFGLSGIIMLKAVSAAANTNLGFRALQIFVGLGMITYFIYFEGKNGQTPAKMFLNLKVMKKDGSECGYFGSLVRNILRIIDILPQAYILGATSILLTSENQRVGDLAGGTVVVDEGNQPGQTNQQI
ncbi:MAG: RDD family protein [Nanohaloarchaea archaeon SW_7_43_1]|nr:MAG: RDD family protein [Nanohaloarchaea archaeon SW_7_43_1]